MVFERDEVELIIFVVVRTHFVTIVTEKVAIRMYRKWMRGCSVVGTMTGCSVVGTMTGFIILFILFFNY